jgi:phosphatidylethanolamine-binding protein (PEBP) family uncharacterized protein
MNSYGKLGYAGPCPPPADSAHRYVIRLYALSRMLEITGRPTREELQSALGGSVISTIELQGRYRRIVQRAG